MALAHRKSDSIYTYKDYLTWDDGQRWEIIDGIAYMQAAPTWEHQHILSGINTQFYNYLVGKKCQVYPAPFDVRLQEGDEADADTSAVVQPDVSVICDMSKLKGTGYFGVPSLIVEILSPSTAAYDKKTKRKRYERAGVKELWMVDPFNKTVDIFILQNSIYGQPETYSDEDKVTVSIFPDLEVDLNLVFEY